MKTFRHTKPEKNLQSIGLPYKTRQKKSFREKENESQQKYGSTQYNKSTGNGDNVGKHMRCFSYHLCLFKRQLTFKQK